MTSKMTVQPGGAGAQAAVLVATLVFFYMVSQFMRNSVAVIAPNLAAEMNLSAADLGVLSSGFFLAFAAAQLPVGVAIDRFGPKSCMLVAAAITVLGALVFALASSAWQLTAGRVLMGVGCSTSLMGPLALYARHFSPHRFATLTGLQLGFGGIGNLFATAPLAFATAAFGWRSSFVGVAGITLLAGLLISIVIRGAAAGPAQTAGRESFRESLGGILAVMRTPSVSRLFAMQLTGYSTFTLFFGLWGGPYLTHIHGFDLTERGDLLLVGVFGLVVGSIAWGPTDRLFRSYKRPVLTGAWTAAAMLLALIAFDPMPAPLLVAWLAAFGLTTAATAVLIAHGRALFPAHLVGRGMTLLNMATMIGVFVTQAVSGLVIDLFPIGTDGAYPLAAYRLIFAVQAGFIVVTSLFYLRADDPWRRTGATKTA